MPFRRGGGGDRYSWGPPPRTDRGTMREISTKTLFITGKKYFLVMMENKVEKFLKFSEVLLNGQKSKIIMDITTALEFYEKLTDMCQIISSKDFKKDMRPVNRDSNDVRNVIKSESIFHSERRYYLDLQQNFRGVFLKLTMRTPTSDRVQLIVPSSGLTDVKDALEGLLKEYGYSVDASKKSKQDNSSDNMKIVDSETYHHGNNDGGGDYDPFNTNSGGGGGGESSKKKKKVIYIPDSDEEVDETMMEEEEDGGDVGGGDGTGGDNNNNNNGGGGWGGTTTTTTNAATKFRDDSNKKMYADEGGDGGNAIVCSDRKFLFEVKRGEDGGMLKITEVANKFRSVVNVPECLWKQFISDVESRIIQCV